MAINHCMNFLGKQISAKISRKMPLKRFFSVDANAPFYLLQFFVNAL